MSMPTGILQVIVAAVVLTSCGAPRSSASPTPRQDPNVITAEELNVAVSGTLYDAVRMLRPAWTRRDRPTALDAREQSELLVYVDGTRFGNLESLRQLTPRGVASIRFHSPGSAEAKFGPGHLLGAIEITTIGR